MSSCNPPIYKVANIFAAKESACNQPAIISTTSAAEVQVSPKIEPKTAMIENNVSKASLTQTPQIPSTTTADGNFTAFLKGSGSVNTEPAIGVYLEGCGLEKVALKKITKSASSGILEAGLHFTTAAADSGYIHYIDGDSVYLSLATGSISAAEVLTLSNGSTITASSASAAAGYAYKPISTNFSALTMRVENQGVSKEMFGSMGSFSLSSDSSAPLQAEFKFQGRMGNYLRVATSSPSSTILAGASLSWSGGTGKLTSDYSSGESYMIYEVDSGNAITSGQTITAGAQTLTAAASSIKTIDSYDMAEGVSYETTIPPILQCSNVSFEGFYPVIQKVEFDQSNEISMRKDLNSCDGFAPSKVNSRKPTIKYNPEMPKTSEYDIFSKWKKGALVQGNSVKWGSVAGNTIVLVTDQLQWQSVTEGDRDGISIVDAEALVTSTKSNWEYQLLFI